MQRFQKIRLLAERAYPLLFIYEDVQILAIRRGGGKNPAAHSKRCVLEVRLFRSFRQGQGKPTDLIESHGIGKVWE